MPGKVRLEINVETRDAIKSLVGSGDTYDSLLMDMVRVYTMRLSDVPQSSEPVRIGVDDEDVQRWIESLFEDRGE